MNSASAETLRSVARRASGQPGADGQGRRGKRKGLADELFEVPQHEKNLLMRGENENNNKITI